jgi:hypothetical protein
MMKDDYPRLVFFKTNPSARELLFALGWVIAKYHIVERYCSLNATQQTISSHDPYDNTIQSFMKTTRPNTNQLTTPSDAKTNINQSVTNMRKLYCTTRALYEQIRYTSRLNAELNTMGGTKGMTPFEAELCSSNSQLLENQKSRLEYTIGICERVVQFYVWMESVFAEDRTGATTSQGTKSESDVLRFVNMEEEEM